MEKVVQDLKKLIKGKTLFVGVGNIMRQDDGAGVYLVKRLKRVSREPNAAFLNVGISPENYLGKICNMKPDTIIFFDIAQFNEKPGRMKIFKPKQLKQSDISTHGVSIGLSIKYLKNELGTDNIFIVGIQPEKIDVGTELSDVIKETIDKFVKAFKSNAALISLAVFMLVYLAGCGAQEIVKNTQFLMGTTVSISVVDGKDAKEAMGKAFLQMMNSESIFSTYREESEAFKVNQNAYKEAVEISPKMLYLLAKSKELDEKTNGAFDVSIGALIDLWNSAGTLENRLPSEEEIKSALENSGMYKVIIDSQKQTVRFFAEGVKLNFSGIAKGYAVDEAINTLKEDGIKNALVNAGGDMFCLGAGKEKKGWKIGIQHPRKPDAILGTFYISDKAVATSGDYENYFDVEGRRYSHIINPLTGFPVAEIPVSVTVVAPDCLTADAFATGIFVLGPKKGMELVEKEKDIEAVIISIKNEKLDILISQGLQDKIHLQH